jgi:hypothetical protein
MGKHYVNEIGTQFLLDMGVTLGTADVVWIKRKKPSGELTGTWYGDLYSSYSELAAAIGTYYISHVLAGTDLNEAGDWKFQGVVANTAGTWYGESATEVIFDAFA